MSAADSGESTIVPTPIPDMTPEGQPGRIVGAQVAAHAELAEGDDAAVEEVT